MIEIRACAADFAQLVAAENVTNRGFGRFAARFIRTNQIRGHDENGRIARLLGAADDQGWHANQSADRRAKIRGDLAYRSLTGVISTRATPLFVRPIFCAAAGDRSRLRPRTAGPRSLILTWVERPFFRLVTLKLDPSGSVFEAAVRALGSKRSPLEVRCPS
jgi:hypothetical protein